MFLLCVLLSAIVCTVTESKTCPDGWEYYGDNCYYISKETQTWYDARRTCQGSNPGAELASFHSETEANVVTKRLYRDMWIGLNSLEKPDELKWSDGTQVVDGYLTWDANEPSSAEEKCIELVLKKTNYKMGIETGRLNDNNCDRKFNFACELTNVRGACPPDWKRRLSSCYYFSTFRATWADARNYCVQNKSADLVSFSDKDEQSYLSSEMVKDVWIGHYYTSSDAKWRWTDGSAIDYLRWDLNEPNNLDTEQCTEALFTKNWNNLGCDYKRRFVCKFALQEANPCPPRWIRNDARCYNFSRDKLQWLQALQECGNLDERAVLVTMIDENEYYFVKNLMTPAVWIGLNQLAETGKHVWSDGSQVTFTQWDGGQPDNYGDSGENCVEMYAVLRENGEDDSVWNDLTCAFSRPFVCKLRAGRCPERWESYNGQCYYFSDFSTSWERARGNCKLLQNGADLVSISSEEESRFIAGRLHINSWIGLHNMGNNDFVWVDAQDRTYDKWGFSHPVREDVNNCVQMYSPTDYWSNIDCLSSRKYICKIDRAMSPEDVLRSNRMKANVANYAN